MKSISRLSVFGDSILKGVILGDDNRYKLGTSLGLEKIAEKYNMAIINKSKFGCTIEKGFSMLKRSIENGMVCDAAVLEFGGNDCDFNWSDVSANPNGEFTPNTCIDRFKVIYCEMIDYLRQHGIIPILTNLPPIDAQKYFNWICRGGLKKENILSWLGDVEAIYRYQEMYSNAVESVAKMKNTVCIDIRTAFLQERTFPSLICMDGIHPSLKGQKLINKCIDMFLCGCREMQTA